MRLAVLIVASLMLPATAISQDIATKADSIMRAAEAKGFSGVIRLAKNGQVLFEKGYGLANRAGKIPFTPTTVVQIGSNTKDFTAVAILQLKERGAVDLADRLSRFFPEAPADKKDITIKQLLNHTAGFPLALGEDFEPLTRQQLIDRAMASKLLFTPGSRESYSNPGFALLAAIIEQASGKSYDVYVRDNILVPAGLKHTGFLLPGFSEADLAHGYRSGGEDAGILLSKPHAPDGPYWNLRGNGGMLSTLSDMHAFYRTLFETGKLLKPETRSLRFNPAEPMGLAGSDLVNFFLYERMPQQGVEMLIASTNADMKGPVVRNPLAEIMGLPPLGGARDTGPPLARAAGRPASAPVAKVVNDFIATVNKGDRDGLVRFIAEHFIITSDGPTPEQRSERLAGMHANLGKLTVVRITEVGPGSLQALLETEREGTALLLVEIEQSAPWRIKRLGIQVGS